MLPVRATHRLAGASCGGRNVIRRPEVLPGMPGTLRRTKMDKLRLLLSAGTMLGLVAGTANATSILNQDGSPATPTGVGQGTLLDGFSEMGGPYSGYQGLEPETAVPWSVPQPGKVNVRINFFANEFPMA